MKAKVNRPNNWGSLNLSKGDTVDIVHDMHYSHINMFGIAPFDKNYYVCFYYGKQELWIISEDLDYE